MTCARAGPYLDFHECKAPICFVTLRQKRNHLAHVIDRRVDINGACEGRRQQLFFNLHHYFTSMELLIVGIAHCSLQVLSQEIVYTLHRILRSGPTARYI
jgi:hypothetical protein